MSQIDLGTKDGNLELVFNFYANRQYERKRQGQTTPDFVTRVISSRVPTDDFLAMLECCLIKHHPKLRGARLEKIVESYLDKQRGSIGDICAPLVDAIVESKMFTVTKKDDDTEEADYAAPDPDDVSEEERAEILGGEPVRKDVLDPTDPTS